MTTDLSASVEAVVVELQVAVKDVVFCYSVFRVEYTQLDPRLEGRDDATKFKQNEQFTV